MYTFYNAHSVWLKKWKSSPVDGIAPAAIGRLVIHIVVVVVVRHEFGSPLSFSFSFLLNLARRWKVKWKLCACGGCVAATAARPAHPPLEPYWTLQTDQYAIQTQRIVLLAIICVRAQHTVCSVFRIIRAFWWIYKHIDSAERWWN